MIKTNKNIISFFIVISMIITLFSNIIPMETVFAATSSAVKIYADKTDKEMEELIDEGVINVVDTALQNWYLEGWHYSGGYWKINGSVVYDKDIVKTAGGVADIGTLEYKPCTFNYYIGNDTELAKAINDGENVYVNITSGKDGITLGNLYKVQTVSNGDDNPTIASNVDGTMLNSDSSIKIEKEGSQWVIRITMTPKLNFYTEDELSYKTDYPNTNIKKWIPFVRNGYGYQKYAIWRNGKSVGAADGWVDFNNPNNIENMPVGKIHPTQIVNSLGQLKEGTTVNIDYENGTFGTEAVNRKSNDFRIGWETFVNAGAVGCHFDFPVNLSVWVGGDKYPDGKVVSTYVKFAGVNADGTPKYEKIKSEVEPAELDIDGTVIVEDIKEIDEGTAYLNDVLTSPKDLTDGSDNADNVSWDNVLPETPHQKINVSADDVWSYNLNMRAGFMTYLWEFMTPEDERFREVSELVNNYAEKVNAYVNASQANKEAKAKEVDKAFNSMMTALGLDLVQTVIDNLNHTEYNLKLYMQQYVSDAVFNMAAQDVSNAVLNIVENSEYIENPTRVKVESISSREESYSMNNKMAGNGEIIGESGVIGETTITNAKVDKKTTLYLRYIVKPERKVRHFIHVIKNGVEADIIELTEGLPVIESGDGYDPYVDIPVVQNAELVEWRTSKDLPLLKTMPTNPIQKGTTLEPISLESDENLYVHWVRRIDTSTVVPDNRLLVEQWRLSKYSDNLGYNAKAYMNLGLTSDETSHVSSTLSPNGNYSYKTINPNGKYTDSSYNPDNMLYNDYLHSKALTKGSYKVTHSSPSVLVDMTGNLNLIKGSNTFGLKAASWLTDNGTKNGLSQHGIQTSSTPSTYSGGSTVVKDDTLSYGIYNNSTYKHKYTIYRHSRKRGCRCYTRTERISPSGATYLTADYCIHSTFDRYIAQASNKLSVSPSISENNGLTKVTYQVPIELKVYPEVAMLFDNDKGDSSIKWVVGEQARVISPVVHHTLQFKLFVNQTSNTPNSATDSRAFATAKSMGLGNRQTTYKGAPVNTTYNMIREEGSKNTGILTLKTFALDIKDNVKSDWGNSGYNSLKYHNDFKGKWTMNGLATANLEVDANGTLTKGATKTKDISLSVKKYGSSDTTTFEHELIVRGGSVVGVKYMDRNSKAVSVLTIAQLQTKDSALYDALVSMKLVGNKNDTVFVGFEHLKGVELTEQKYVDLVNQAKLSKDGITTNNISVGNGWYSEDTTVLVIKEYVTNYNVPTTTFSDKLSLSLNGLQTPTDKNQFFSKLGKGHSLINYTFKSGNIGFGLNATKVYFEHNSRLGSEFGKKNVDYLVGNVSVLDTTSVN